MKKTVILLLMTCFVLLNVTLFDVYGAAPSCTVGAANCIVENPDGGFIGTQTYNFTPDSIYNRTWIPVIFLEEYSPYIASISTLINGNYVRKFPIDKNITVDECGNYGPYYLQASYEPRGEYLYNTYNYYYNYSYNFFIGDYFYEVWQNYHRVYRVYDICNLYTVYRVGVDPNNDPYVSGVDAEQDIIFDIANSSNDLAQEDPGSYTMSSYVMPLPWYPGSMAAFYLESAGLPNPGY